MNILISAAQVCDNGFTMECSKAICQKEAEKHENRMYNQIISK
jgi:hypothetical protein